MDIIKRETPNNYIKSFLVILLILSLISSSIALTSCSIETTVKRLINDLNNESIAVQEVAIEKLTEIGITAGILIGKSGETGLKQKKQIETVQKFRDGEFQVLVATRVGEEGLDISEVNQVIFYDNIPSSIRFIQRRGRTGRKVLPWLRIISVRSLWEQSEMACMITGRNSGATH